MLKANSSLSNLICQAKSFVGNGVIGNRIPLETPFMRAKANPVLIAQKKVHIEGAEWRDRKPLVGAGLALPMENGRGIERGQGKPSPYEMREYGAIRGIPFRSVRVYVTCR